MNIRKFFIASFVIISFMPAINFSQDRGFGLGVMIGEPTGFSGKYWVDENHAVDFGLAYSFVHTNHTFSLHGDYLFHSQEILKSSFRLPVYYGFGARLHLGNSGGNTLGARGVIGILFLPQSLPIDIFIEFAPVFNLFPETSLHLDFAVGGRYYFD